MNLKKMRHLRRAFQRFCASSHPSYKRYMLENLAFFHNSSKTPDDADIANRKHYSAPAGALTKFFGRMRLAFREQLVVLMHRVPEGLPCPFTSGHCFFFSIAERAITALSVIASRRNCKRTCIFWQLIHSVPNSYHNVSTCSGEKQNQHNTKKKITLLRVIHTMTCWVEVVR